MHIGSHIYLAVTSVKNTIKENIAQLSEHLFIYCSTKTGVLLSDCLFSLNANTADIVILVRFR